MTLVPLNNAHRPNAEWLNFNAAASDVGRAAIETEFSRLVDNLPNAPVLSPIVGEDMLVFKRAVGSLIDFLHVDDTVPEDLGDRSLRFIHGNLGPSSAKACLYDTIRTKRFLMALERRLTTVLNSKDGPVHVIDAGCGPYPIYSIGAALKDPRVQVTAIECNPVSTALAKKCVEKFGLSSQISILHADATTYEPEVEVNVLISETMAMAFAEEDCTNVLNHLAKFVAADGFVIPEDISILKAVVSRASYYRPASVAFNGSPNPASVIELAGEEVTNWVPGNNLNRIAVQDIQTDIPEALLLLRCQINLCGNDITLGAIDSNISQWLSAGKIPQGSASFEYVPGKLFESGKFSS